MALSFLSPPTPALSTKPSAQYTAPEGAYRRPDTAPYPTTGFHYSASTAPLGRAASPPLQGVFVQSKAFSKNGNTSSALEGIKDYLIATDPDFDWLVKSPNVTVQFNVNNAPGDDDALGTTRFTNNGIPVGAQFFLRNHSQNDIDNLKLGIEIVVDKTVSNNNPIGTYITIAHEIGVHLKPRIKLLRAVAEKKAKPSDIAMAFVDHATDAEHSAVYQPDLQTEPENKTYRDIVTRFYLTLKHNHNDDIAEYLSNNFIGDVSRYGKDNKKDIITTIIANRNLQNAKLRELVLTVFNFAKKAGISVVVILMAILMYYSMSKSKDQK